MEFDQDAPESSPDVDEVAQQLKDEVSTSNPLAVESNSITVISEFHVFFLKANHQETAYMVAFFTHTYIQPHKHTQLLLLVFL